MGNDACVGAGGARSSRSGLALLSPLCSPPHSQAVPTPTPLLCSRAGPYRRPPAPIAHVACAAQRPQRLTKTKPQTNAHHKQCLPQPKRAVCMSRVCIVHVHAPDVNHLPHMPAPRVVCGLRGAGWWWIVGGLSPFPSPLYVPRFP